MKNFKMPISEVVISASSLVPHDTVQNVALSSATVDKGLKPNGVTIADMRANPDLYSHQDTLDRCAIASKESTKLSSDVKKVVRAIKSAETDRNKSKVKFI